MPVLTAPVATELDKASLLEVLDLAIALTEPDTYGCFDCQHGIADMCEDHGQMAADNRFYRWVNAELIAASTREEMDRVLTLLVVA